MLIDINKNKLIESGAIFGGPKWLWNPQMSSYISEEKKTSFKNKFHILDWKKIINNCQVLGNYVNDLIKQKKIILFLSTEKKAQEIVKEQAIRCKMPYIVNKWKGGFLTNFWEIRKKLKELERLNKFIDKDDFRSLIKKEQAKLNKKRDKLQSIYEGVLNLYQKPDVLFIIGLDKGKTALKEAKKIGIEVIAVCNTTCNPKSIDYVIPGNDKSIKSISIFASLMADIIIETKNKAMARSDIDERK